MKKILLTLLAVPILTISCNGEEKKEKTQKEKKEVKKDTTSEETNWDIIIDDTTTVLHLKYGNLANYTTDLHPSIGEEIIINIEDTTVFNVTGSEFEYDSKERPIQPGGDAGKKTYHFKTMAPGETTMTIKKIFRGEVQREQKIKIFVARLQKSGGDLKE